jgi:hypothetical protein
MKPLPKEFLLSRGSCCKNGCKNCPWGYNKINKNMNTEEKYYVPNREDFKEGFEYEQLYNTYSPPDFKLTDSKWVKQVFDDFTSEENYLFNRQLMDNNIRVPFLTKEDIEKEGWENIEEIDDAGAFEAEKNLGATDYRLCWTFDKILSVYEYGNDCIYRGDCRCINDFRTICKLLNI